MRGNPCPMERGECPAGVLKIVGAFIKDVALKEETKKGVAVEEVTDSDPRFSQAGPQIYDLITQRALARRLSHTTQALPLVITGGPLLRIADMLLRFVYLFR